MLRSLLDCMPTLSPTSSKSTSFYLYTVPKAGTYLLASVLERMGCNNSGFHIGFKGYLDTLGHEPLVSRKTPSKTLHAQFYIKSFKLSANKLSFGHLSPTFLPPGVFRDLNIITAYRNPEEVLISEFNDFRFIREDVTFCSCKSVKDDVEAFSLYLARQVPVIRDIMIEMLRYLDMFCDRLYRIKYAEYTPIVINYNELKDKPYLDWLDQRFTQILPSADSTFSEALQSVYGTETKTKSSGYSFDRQSLWTKQAREMVRQNHLNQLHSRLIKRDSIIRSYVY